MSVGDPYIDSLKAEIADLKRQLAQSTNYIVDDDTYPKIAWFANGRKVWWKGGTEDCLGIDMEKHPAFE